MQGIFAVAVLLISPHLAGAEMSKEALKQQAHDDAKLLRMKLPSDVSDEKVLDLTTQLLARGVPLEVLKWYLDDEQGKGRTGDVLVRDIEALATTMGGGKRMQGTVASLIQTIQAEEDIHDASLDAPFIWPEEEHVQDLKLLEVEKQLLEAEKPHHKQHHQEEKHVSAAEAKKDNLQSKEEKKSEGSSGFAFWDVMFFSLLGLVTIVAGWWAFKMRLHDRALAVIADLVFRAKKWLSSLLKGGQDYERQGDETASDTSLQTGTSYHSGTTSSSGMDGLNNHLQGVIDRVRSSFQAKDGVPAPDVERPATAASEEDTPAKKGYTRRERE